MVGFARLLSQIPFLLAVAVFLLDVADQALLRPLIVVGFQNCVNGSGVLLLVLLPLSPFTHIAVKLVSLGRIREQLSNVRPGVVFGHI